MLSFEHTLCVTQLSSPTRTVFPAEAVPLSNHWISERCDFPLDNHDTHSRRGRSCPKNTESAEIHSADIKALEEMGFSDCLVKPNKQYLACAAFWGWGTCQVPLFVAPVRLCCFLGAWLAQMWTLGPTDALWLCLRTESTLCVSRGLTLFIFLLVDCSSQHSCC